MQTDRWLVNTVDLFMVGARTTRYHILAACINDVDNIYGTVRGMSGMTHVDGGLGAITREHIRSGAARLFAERGFAATSVRDIARAAGVDASLVIRHFGSKEALFLATMSMEGGFGPLIDLPLDDLGRAIVRRVLEAGATRRDVYTALTRAADRADVRAYLVRMISQSIVDPIAARLSGPDPRLRARLIAALITGLLNGLWVLEDPELVDAPTDAVVDRYGAAIQTLLDGS